MCQTQLACASVKIRLNQGVSARQLRRCGSGELSCLRPTSAFIEEAGLDVTHGASLDRFTVSFIRLSSKESFNLCSSSALGDVHGKQLVVTQVFTGGTTFPRTWGSRLWKRRCSWLRSRGFVANWLEIPLERSRRSC